MNANLVKQLKIDTLIFDMDGVLIDVSKSYRQAIIRTVDLFFIQGLKLKQDGKAISLLDHQDIDLLKQAGGFNNDWDVTKAFITYFLEMLPPQSAVTAPLKREIPTMMIYLEILGSHLSTTIPELRQRKNIQRLARGLAGMGGGLDGIEKLLKRRNRHLLPAEGSLLRVNVVERIFQELYLGETLFEQIYQTPAVIVHEPGLINQERLIIDPAILETLSQRMSLGIATGRPKAEAEYSLNQFKIRHYFQSLVTHDDVIAADQQGKPDPWSLIEATRHIQPPPTQSAYIGDTPDDVLAAKAASKTIPFVAIGTLAAANNKRSLRQWFKSHQADLILEHPNHLKEIL